MAGALSGLLAAWADLVLRQSLYAAVVFVVVAGLVRVVGRGNARRRAALWSLVLVRLVLPPDLAHPLALGAVVDRLGAARAPAPAVARPVVRQGFLASPSGERAEAGDLAAGAPAWRSALGAAWLLGFAVAVVSHGRRRRRLRQVLTAARPEPDSGIRALAEDWRRRLRVRRPVRVVSSAAALGPFTTGVLRPVIFLPAVVAGDLRSREAVIAHEMAHVARLDAIWLGLQQLLQLVYFFHPLVRISGARLAEEREHLCDAAVLAAGRIAPRAYAESLLAVLGRGLAAADASALTDRTRRCAMRMSIILSFDHRCRPRPLAAVSLAAAAGFFLLPLAGGAAPPRAEAASPVAEPAADVTIALANPVPDGRVSWSWGPGRDPFSGSVTFHRGIDVAAAAGTPVLAPAAGTVTVATTSYVPSPASGTVLIIDHGSGLATFFAHLGTLAVREGEAVAAGQVVAAIGSTGRSTGPHVHVEVHRDGEPVDPATLVREWQGGRR